MNSTILNSFSELEALYSDKNNRLAWPYVFSLPGWMEAWWRHFGTGYELFIMVLRHGGSVTGIAPFKRQGRTVSFIGDASVCDYLDFIILPGEEPAFFEMLIGENAARGIGRLELGTLRPDSAAVRFLLTLAESHGFNVERQEADVSYEMDLPESYETYLDGLAAKQRHELLRKERNLEMEAGVSFRLLRDEEAGAGDIESFLNLMTVSRKDKARFLTENMKGFFRNACRAMAANGLLRLGFLKLGDKPLAAVLGFEYNNYVYLYNSGYDPDYTDLSVGLMSKLAFIRWSIENHKRGFDFLKGPEVYKKRLGGRHVRLSACNLTIG
jgi:CelD/BcsL family acetyltransferase involved in cellulose biosynthesis